MERAKPTSVRPAFFHLQHTFSLLLTGCMLLAGLAIAQTNQASDIVQRRFQLDIDNLKAGLYGPVAPTQIAAVTRPDQLIPFFESLYAQSKNTDQRLSIATELLRLGVKDDAYWNLIANTATPALESDAPSPRSPQYRAWAKANHVTPGSARKQELQNIWQKILPLAYCGDPRAIPLLREALQSPNTDIQSVAADGLARDHDKGSIPLIIAAINQASADQARILAGALKFYDDNNDLQIKPVLEKYFPAVDPLKALKRDLNDKQDGNSMMGLDLERVANAHEVQAIPVLEQTFAMHRDQTLGIEALLLKIPPPPHETENSYETQEMSLLDELHIANVLIRLGVHDDVYWSYLADQAQASLQINIPFNLEASALGKHNSPPNPAFLAWTKSHNVDQNEAAMFQYFVQPSPIMFLATAGDHRGIPLLRQALASANPMIQVSAAKGLAELHDKASVPLIIAACNRLPVSARIPLAESLLYFNDPQAQQYALLNLPKDIYLSVRQRIAQGHTPFN